MSPIRVLDCLAKEENDDGEIFVARVEPAAEVFVAFVVFVFSIFFDVKIAFFCC